MKKQPYVGMARKYRPQLFDDVVGQEAVSRTLSNAAQSKQPAHAYLFFGPRGVGKTTSARILAKALNCKNGPTPKPCGKCPSCVEIAAGSSIDVLELDAASHTQVDKIREMIIETAGLAPSRDRYKVFIIDEVHMLSTSSFNALLKTLEEPPPHVLFILATTELAKIPATIVSRCQRFRFRPIPHDVMAGYLAQLAKSEGLKADKDALALFSRAAGGSLRDAVSLLEQASAYGKGAVTGEKASELIGTLPAEFLFGIVKAVLAHDAGALTGWLGRVAEEGFDSTQILRDLRERLQELYLHRLGVESSLEEGWDELAAPYAPETFSFLVRRVNSTLAEMRQTDSPQIAFELGIYGMLEPAHDLGEWVARLEALEKRLSAGGEPADEPLPQGAPYAPGTAGSGMSPQPMAAPPSRPAPRPPAEPSKTAAAAPAGPKRSPEEAWTDVAAKLGRAKPALAGSLQSSRIRSSGGGSWSLLFAQSFDAERAESNRKAIEGAFSDAGCGAFRLDFGVDPDLPKPKKANAKAKKSEPQEGWVDASEDDEVEDAGVKKVLGVLGGKVRQVRKKKS